MLASGRAAFVAYVYENDYKEIQKLVKHYPNIETGGDLFGLWKDERTVIIQQFIGPGKDCKRTKTSFHQDIEYLHRVGSLITTEEGLCNVGEWHSHHQIGMPQPSSGDRKTVFSNMPHLGLERFVLFIASIEGAGYGGKKRARDIKLDDIILRPFLFLGHSQDMDEGEIRVITGSNPHRRSNRVMKEIEDGAENEPLDEDGRSTKASEKKKRSGREDSKPAQVEANRKNKSITLQQQANELTSARQLQGKQPQIPPRETKSRRAEVTKPSMDDKSFGSQPPGDEQLEKKEKEAQKRNGVNNENRSPNTGPTVPGHDYQSPPTSPTPPMNTPPHFGTTPPCAPGNKPSTTYVPMSKKDASRHSGGAQGPGPGVQGNAPMSARHPSSSQSSTTGAGPHSNWGAARGDRGTQTQGTSPLPFGDDYSNHHSQLHPTYTQLSSHKAATGQGHIQGNMSYESSSAERSQQAQANARSGTPVHPDKLVAGGFF